MLKVIFLIIPLSECSGANFKSTFIVIVVLEMDLPKKKKENILM